MIREVPRTYENDRSSMEGSLRTLIASSYPDFFIQFILYDQTCGFKNLSEFDYLFSDLYGKYYTVDNDKHEKGEPQIPSFVSDSENIVSNDQLVHQWNDFKLNENTVKILNNNFYEVEVRKALENFKTSLYLYLENAEDHYFEVLADILRIKDMENFFDNNPYQFIDNMSLDRTKFKSLSRKYIRKAYSLIDKEVWFLQNQDKLNIWLKTDHLEFVIEDDYMESYLKIEDALKGRFLHEDERKWKANDWEFMRFFDYLRTNKLIDPSRSHSKVVKNFAVIYKVKHEDSNLANSKIAKAVSANKSQFNFLNKYIQKTSR